MSIINENSCVRSSMPARIGTRNTKKSGTISFHVILFLVELLLVAPGKKQGNEISFTKSAGFTIIITVHAMSPHQPEFEEKYKQYINDDPDGTELEQDIYADNVDKE